MTSQSSVAGPARAPESAPPTLQALAERCGVSVSTISRVLSGQAARYRISPRTEAAVRKLARESNFVPNQIARGLRLRRTCTIGLVVPEISNPFFASIAHQVSSGTRGAGYSLIVCGTDDDLQLEKQSLRLLRSRNVEGIILCPVGLSGEHLREFVGGALPMVLVDRYFPDLPLPYVSSDNVAGARQATELLIASGHRRIACLQGLRGTSPNDMRVRGYTEALRQHYLPVDETLIAGDGFSEESGYIETKLLLATQPDVRAIFALSNLNALGVIRALTEEQRRIPEDVSLISFDDPPYAAYLATPLTTVAQMHAEMGTVALKLLFDQIKSGRGPAGKGILLPTQLVVRKSVRKLEPATN